MRGETRRRERRHSIVSDLSELYPRELNLSKFETGTVPQFLEGLGSMVLDRVHKVAYAALSSRTYLEMVNRWADTTGYRVVTFHAAAQHEEALDFALPGTEVVATAEDEHSSHASSSACAPSSSVCASASAPSSLECVQANDSVGGGRTRSLSKLTAHHHRRNLLRAGLLARMEAVGKAPSAVAAVLDEHDCALVHYTSLALFVGSSLALFCAEAVYHEGERADVLASLRASHHTLVLISEEQMATFCAQLMELRGRDDQRILIMSTGAEQAFTDAQLDVIRTCCDRLVSLDLSLFEVIAGASVGSLFAELF
jgi:hypothetical protein